MGASKNIVGIIPPDKKWMEMKAVHDACRKANIIVPAEVSKFFGYEDPDKNGVVLPLTTGSGSTEKCLLGVSLIQESGTEGYLVELCKLNPDIKFLRFTIDY